MKKKNKKSKKQGPNKVELDNAKRQLFVFLYVNDRACFGNATKAYQLAYNSNYNTARSAGNRLLTNVDIIRSINEMLDEQLKDVEVDRALALTIKQNKDLQSKVQAIKEYNRMKDRGSGKLEGKFTFAWEGDDEKQNKKPKIKKVELSTKDEESNVSWDGEEK